MSFPDPPQRVLLEWEVRGQKYAVVIDATIHETHDVKAQVTEHQVETGSNVTDHIRPLPREVTLEGVITNTPLAAPARTSISGNMSDFSQSFQRPNGDSFEVKWQAYKFDGQFDRVRDEFRDLVYAIQQGALFDITTTLQVYVDFAMTSFSVPRDAANGNVLHFSASFKELRFVETNTTKALPVKTAPKVAKKHDGPKHPEEAKPEESRSALHHLIR